MSRKQHQNESLKITFPKTKSVIRGYKAENVGRSKGFAMFPDFPEMSSIVGAIAVVSETFPRCPPLYLSKRVINSLNKRLAKEIPDFKPYKPVEK